jgi:MscS family membrane protein
MENLLSSFQNPEGSPMQRYAMLLFLLVVLFLLGKLTKYITNRASGKQMKLDKPVFASFLKAISKSATFFLVIIGLVIASNFLHFPEQYHGLIGTLKKILVVISIGYIIFQLIDVPGVWFSTMTDKKENAHVNKMFIPVIRKTLHLTVIILVILQIFQILYDKPIATIVAGLGVGSIAIAFAAQDTLRHFIGSFVIAGDKPFEIGQRVNVDGHDGFIESIGLRSTNIRTLEGHVVIIPNGELANRTIKNIGQRKYIRRLANINITYDTPPEKIERALEILKDILDNHEGMNPEFPPRVYFSEFNSDSLNLLFLYWYHPPDYWAYMAYGEKVNLAIIRRFNEEGIDFAFPTQTLHLAGDPKRPLNIGMKEQVKKNG